MASPITLDGLRLAFRTMIRNHERTPPPSLFLKRGDGHILEVAMRKLVRYGEHETQRFEVVVHWDIENEMEELSPFVSALNRYMCSPASAYTVEVIDANLCAIDNEDAAPKCFDVIKKLLTMEMCSCDFGVVEENEVVCLTCLACLAEKDMSKHLCGVCHERCNAQIQTTKCCHQWIHTHCKQRCGLRCPFCRSVRINTTTTDAN